MCEMAGRHYKAQLNQLDSLTQTDFFHCNNYSLRFIIAILFFRFDKITGSNKNFLLKSLLVRNSQEPRMYWWVKFKVAVEGIKD